MKTTTLLSLSTLAVLALVPDQARAHGHEGCHPEAIMQTGDFDGDGVIGSGDIEMISAYVEAGDYAAFFDMNVDGVLDGRDVSAVAKRMGEAGSPRDAEMAQLWAAVEPYRDVNAALGDGYTPFTPNLMGHGIHFANFDLIWSWGERGFTPSEPEGLNYTADGELVAAFYYAPAAIDLYDYGLAPDPGVVYQTLPPPHAFSGGEHHDWHNHTGACFGAATCPVLGFDQCVTEQTCYDLGGSLWSDKFHMIHVWLFELNECGPFAGIDHDISMGAPHEPNHHACNLADLVPVALDYGGQPITPMGFVPDACYE